jgi:hypothetical protein
MHNICAPSHAFSSALHRLQILVGLYQEHVCVCMYVYIYSYAPHTALHQFLSLVWICNALSHAHLTSLHNFMIVHRCLSVSLWPAGKSRFQDIFMLSRVLARDHGSVSPWIKKHFCYTPTDARYHLRSSSVSHSKLSHSHGMPSPTSHLGGEC